MRIIKTTSIWGLGLLILLGLNVQPVKAEFVKVVNQSSHQIIIEMSYYSFYGEKSNSTVVVPIGGASDGGEQSPRHFQCQDVKFITIVVRKIAGGCAKCNYSRRDGICDSTQNILVQDVGDDCIKCNTQ